MSGPRNVSAGVLTKSVERKTPEVFKPKTSIPSSYGSSPARTDTERPESAQTQEKQNWSSGLSVENERSVHTLNTESPQPNPRPPSPTAQTADQNFLPTAVFGHMITYFKQRSDASLVASSGKPGFLDRK